MTEQHFLAESMTYGPKGAIKIGLAGLLVPTNAPLARFHIGYGPREWIITARGNGAIDLPMDVFDPAARSNVATQARGLLAKEFNRLFISRTWLEVALFEGGSR